MKTSLNLNGLTSAGRARARHRAFSAESLALTMQALGMPRSEIRAELERLQPARSKRWRVYYSDGEYARQLGDPLLGIVEASTREEAERKGGALVTIAPPGVWVVEDDAPAKE